MVRICLFRCYSISIFSFKCRRLNIKIYITIINSFYLNTFST
nr:MAG TPA: hypothetical protein [Bacteriophage sp.]